MGATFSISVLEKFFWILNLQCYSSWVVLLRRRLPEQSELGHRIVICSVFHCIHSYPFTNIARTVQTQVCLLFTDSEKCIIFLSECIWVWRQTVGWCHLVNSELWNELPAPLLSC